MTDLIKPAIVAIGYNRPESLSRLLRSIKNAEYKYDDITLIISIDFWKEENLCYRVADAFEWVHGEKIVIKREKKMGLRRHMLACGDLSEKYGVVILLEDDIVVSEQFYNYAIQACDFYYDNDEVMGIGLYAHCYNGFIQAPFSPIKNGYDSYYGRWVVSWGECFCRKQWKDFREWYECHKDEKQIFCSEEIPNQIQKWSESSWGKYVYPYMLEMNKFFALPYESYTTNYAEAGDHVRYTTNVRQTVLQRGYKEYRFAGVDSAIKYDMYFENMDIERFRKNLNVSGSICIDLNGGKTSVAGYDYCLSTQSLPYRVINSFALQIKPIEENVFYGISGEGIYLYDLKQSCNISKKERRKQKYLVEKYYYPALQYKRMLNYMIYETFNKLKKLISGG